MNFSYPLARAHNIVLDIIVKTSVCNLFWVLCFRGLCAKTLIFKDILKFKLNLLLKYFSTKHVLTRYSSKGTGMVDCLPITDLVHRMNCWHSESNIPHVCAANHLRKKRQAFEYFGIQKIVLVHNLCLRECEQMRLSPI